MFRSGSLVLVSADTWEADDSTTYDLENGIHHMCWVNATNCIVAVQNSLDIYTYTIDTRAAIGGATDGFSVRKSHTVSSAITSSFASMNPVPFTLDVEPYVTSLPKT